MNLLLPLNVKYQVAQLNEKLRKYLDDPINSFNFDEILDENFKIQLTIGLFPCTVSIIPSDLLLFLIIVINDVLSEKSVLKIFNELKELVEQSKSVTGDRLYRKKENRDIWLTLQEKWLHENHLTNQSDKFQEKTVLYEVINNMNTPEPNNIINYEMIKQNDSIGNDIFKPSRSKKDNLAQPLKSTEYDLSKQSHTEKSNIIEQVKAKKYNTSNQGILNQNHIFEQKNSTNSTLTSYFPITYQKALFLDMKFLRRSLNLFLFHSNCGYELIERIKTITEKMTMKYLTKKVFLSMRVDLVSYITHYQKNSSNTLNMEKIKTDGTLRTTDSLENIQIKMGIGHTGTKIDENLSLDQKINIMSKDNQSKIDFADQNRDTLDKAQSKKIQREEITQDIATLDHIQTMEHLRTVHRNIKNVHFNPKLEPKLPCLDHPLKRLKRKRRGKRKRIAQIRKAFS